MTTGHRAAVHLILLAAAMAVSAAAHGATDERVYVSPMGSYIVPDEDRGALEDGTGGTLSVGRAFGDWWNVELRLYDATIQPETGGLDRDLRGAGLDALLFASRNRYFSPYFVLGGAFQRTEIGTSDFDNGVAQSGLGFFSRLTDGGTGIRVDARYQVDFFDSPSTGTEEFQDVVYNIGLVIPFGEAADREPARAPEPEDHDGDGVPDADDVCPNTPADAAVDAQGCALDSDGDGVTDAEDQCPATAAGVEVDARGCEVPDVIDLEGVAFPSGSDRLTPGAREVLDETAETFKTHRNLVAVVAGHTDSVGAAEENRRLSQFRAETVRDYLIARGVDPDQLTARGYGESEPVASNETAEGREQNRRVELRIIKR